MAKGPYRVSLRSRNRGHDVTWTAWCCFPYKSFESASSKQCDRILTLCRKRNGLMFLKMTAKESVTPKASSSGVGGMGCENFVVDQALRPPLLSSPAVRRVICHSQVVLKQLETDLRRLLAPNTATHLKVSFSQQSCCVTISFCIHAVMHTDAAASEGPDVKRHIPDGLQVINVPCV